MNKVLSWPATCVVDPTAQVSPAWNVSLGQFVVIEARVRVGRRVSIGHHTVIEEDVWIGNHVRIYQLCSITKGAVIENDVFIGPGVIMLNTRRISHDRGYEPILTPPVIKRGARIGGGCVILPGVLIGEEALIGAGSTVAEDVPHGEVYFGHKAVFRKRVPYEEWFQWHR